MPDNAVEPIWLTAPKKNVEATGDRYKPVTSSKKAIFFAALGLLLSACITTDQPSRDVAEEAPTVIENAWWNAGQSAIQQRRAIVPKIQAAKNVIVFIGDGMGVSTLTAGRIFDGQSRGETGEENLLSFESFPYTALVKTYNTNQQVPDSAGTASSIHTGLKTRAGVIGISEHARRGHCAEAKQFAVPVMGERVRNKDLALGIVTTTRITHATPASVYAHVPERGWENDSKLTAQAKQEGCTDIAEQLVTFNERYKFDVVLGGGEAHFVPEASGGKRREGDLIQRWQDGGGLVVKTRREMMSSSEVNKPLLGLFSSSHMTYMADRESDSTEPTLTEMTEAAISRLERQPKGYYLLVEGGRIDHAHHDGVAGKALMETQEFSRAVSKALEMVDLDETLVLVTADHSHVFTIAGYPTRGNPILDVVRGNDSQGEPVKEPALANDGQPYTTLGYWNGPGAVKGQRQAPETGIHARQHAAVPTAYHTEAGTFPIETHGGEDVVLYAVGPRAHLVSGLWEQNVIFHLIRHAFGWD